jgi:hypothetical protein
VLVELLATAVAVVLITAILVSELRVPRGSRAADRGLPGGVAGPTTSGGAGPGPRPSSLLPPAAGNLLDDPSFEVGLGRWQAGTGARLTRVGDARSGSWAASLAAGNSASPSMGIREVRRCQLGMQYAVTVWLRAAHPGTVVRVDLVEESAGRRYAVDTAGAVLQGQRWEPLEVRHVTHRPGAALAIQVAAVELPTGGHVLVDDLTLQAATASSRP